MQNVRVLSSDTNELIQVTPSSALRSTTPRQVSTPPSATGMCSPSGNVRCTMYRGMSVLLLVRPLDMTPSYGPPGRVTSGGPPRLGRGAPHLGRGGGGRSGALNATRSSAKLVHGAGVSGRVLRSRGRGDQSLIGVGSAHLSGPVEQPGETM